MAFQNTVGTPSTYVSENTGDAILKEWYSEEGVTDEIFVDNPFLALSPKKEDVTGRFYNQPIYVSSSQGRSRSATQAYTVSTTAAGSNSTVVTGEALFDFQVKKVENFAYANINNQLIAESSTSKGAFVDMLKLIPDGVLHNFANDISLNMFRGADISRGQVGGSVAGTTLTLANVADYINFELGMWLDFSATNSGSSTTFASASTAYCQVIAIDQVNGPITVAFSSGTNTLTANSVAVGNFVYQSGDKSLGMNGFKDWIPQGQLASTDSFNGVNRSLNQTKLAGTYMNGQGQQLEEVLEAGIAQVSRLEGKLTHYLMSPGQYRALAQAQGSKVQLINVLATPQIGFKGIQVVGFGTGPVVCLPDRSCPADLVAGINREAWKLISVDKVVHLWQKDGKAWLRLPGSAGAGMEIRFYSLANLVCSEPRSNINISVNPTV